MDNFWIFVAALLGYAVSALTSMGGPLSLALARRRGFWVGWEAREKYPADAPPRTRQQVAQLLAEDEQRLLDGHVESSTVFSGGNPTKNYEAPARVHEEKRCRVISKSPPAARAEALSRSSAPASTATSPYARSAALMRAGSQPTVPAPKSTST